jgi:hypothetical protein
MLRKSRVPGNTLIFTIVIALILAILSIAVITLGYYSRQHQITANIEQRLSRNLESAINLVLEDSTGGSFRKSETFDLFENDADSVTITTVPWGIFEVACVTAFSNVYSKKQGFVSGSGLPAYMDGCLYLADHRRPLSVNGNTILTGDVYLSKGGIKPIYINQRGFNGSKLVDGTIKTSADALPELNTAILDHLIELNSDSSGIALELQAGDSLVRTFYDSTLCIYSKDPVNLSGLTVKGNIVIRADSLIEVDATTRIEDAILSAPIIRFKQGFKGNVQAIASDSIIIESGSVLDYPSALVLLKDPTLKMQNVLRMESGCVVNGIIVAECEKDDITRCRVELMKNTQINGIVYIMGYCYLRGTINGVVLTDYFIYQDHNMMYENTLVDVAVNRLHLSPYFIGSNIFQKPAAKQIIKWVK